MLLDQQTENRGKRGSAKKPRSVVFFIVYLFKGFAFRRYLWRDYLNTRVNSCLRKPKCPFPRVRSQRLPRRPGRSPKTIGKPVAIKSQVWAGGRGKAGGIKFAEHGIDAEIVANQMLGSEIKGLKVEKVLVEEKLAIDKEYYVGVIINPGQRSPGSGDHVQHRRRDGYRIRSFG